MSVKFQREKPDDFLKDGAGILYDHLKEASDIPGDAVHLDFDSYTTLDRSNTLHIITGRNEKGELDRVDYVSFA